MWVSGTWTAYWTVEPDLEDPVQNVHELRLEFRDASVSGRGVDMVGDFVLNGRAQGDAVRIEKMYLGAHTVIYEGKRDEQGCIVGRWHIPPSTSGRFLWAPPGVEGPEALAEAWYRAVKRERPRHDRPPVPQGRGCAMVLVGLVILWFALGGGMMFDLSAIQAALADEGLDGWLLYDFRGLNVLARRVLRFPPDAHATRRWFYFIPATGEPWKLVHRIEPGTLDACPGGKSIYLRWQELEKGVADLIAGAKRIAMEYVPRNANPYISRVDAGTVELVRSCGVEIVPSGDLIQRFEACWDDDQWALHLEASKHTSSAYDTAWKFIADAIRAGRTIHEMDVQRVIMDHFARHRLVTDHPPIVGVGPHSGDPHYAPAPGDAGIIRDGSFVLIDLWAKCDRPRAVYSDLTWTGFVGTEVPEKYESIFQIVRAARDAGIERVKKAFAAGESLQGWQVDQATRDVIDKAGHGPAFCHRTGHSIGEETHGNGANMDNLETHETRRVLRRTCFSIEPGIYLPEFGVRSEVDVFIDAEGTVHVTGPTPQTAVVPVLRAY